MQITLFEKFIKSIFKISLKNFSMMVVLLTTLGLVCNLIFSFPWHLLFSILFCCIIIACFIAEKEFIFVMDPLGKNQTFFGNKIKSFHDIKPVHMILSGTKAFEVAIIHLKRRQKSFWNILLPSAVLLFYLVVGLTIFQSKEFNLTLGLMLFLFSIATFLSIIGYLQYIYLALFVRELSKIDYVQLPKIETDEIMFNKNSPVHTGWLEQLTKFVGIYQNYFFGLGSLYITGYAVLCFSGSFGVDISINNIPMLAGWLFIFLAIALVFPATYLMEREWIKKILASLKNEQIHELKKKKERKSNNELWAEIKAVRISLILLSPDYPKHSVPQMAFTIVLAFLNFFSVAVSIIQFCFPTL